MIEEGTSSQGISVGSQVTAAAPPPPVSPSQGWEGNGDILQVTAAAPPPHVFPSKDTEGTEDGLQVDAAAAPHQPVSPSQE